MMMITFLEIIWQKDCKTYFITFDVVRYALGKMMSGHGEVRRGHPGMNSQREVTPHDHIAAEAAGYDHGTPIQVNTPCDLITSNKHRMHAGLAFISVS